MNWREDIAEVRECLFLGWDEAPRTFAQANRALERLEALLGRHEIFRAQIEEVLRVLESEDPE